MRNSLLAILMLLLSLLASCTPSVPSQYVQPGELEDILYDYHIAQAVARQEGGKQGEINNNVYLAAVLRKYNLTEANLDSSMVYYYAHAEQLKRIYGKVTDRLNDNAKAFGAAYGTDNQYASYSADGDTANIWRDGTEAILMPQPPYNRIDFAIKGDTAMHKGDTFLFQLMAHIICQSGTKDAIACVNLKYDNDSVATFFQHITVTGVLQMRIGASPQHAVKEIYGYLFMNCTPDDQNTMKLYSLSQIQFIRFHNKNNEPANEKNSVPQLNREPERIDSLRGGTPPRPGSQILPIESRTAPNGMVRRDSSSQRK
ncbi:MAG: DUF4296 domain-containing protein [Prevotella sp.]|nr:DUF4296 domain-containing protein [Prevotella sp.]